MCILHVKTLTYGCVGTHRKQKENSVDTVSIMFLAFPVLLLLYREEQDNDMHLNISQQRSYVY